MKPLRSIFIQTFAFGAFPVVLPMSATVAPVVYRPCVFNVNVVIDSCEQLRRNQVCHSTRVVERAARKALRFMELPEIVQKLGCYHRDPAAHGAKHFNFPRQYERLVGQHPDRT